MKQQTSIPIGWSVRGALLGLLVGLVVFQVRPFLMWAGLYLAAVNATTFALYGYDKSLARRQKFRIPEATLHVLALIGGSPAAALGRVVFRHKLHKTGFGLIFDAIVMIQFILVLWWFKTTQTGTL